VADDVNKPQKTPRKSYFPKAVIDPTIEESIERTKSWDWEDLAARGAEVAAAHRDFEPPTRYVKTAWTESTNQALRVILKFGGVYNLHRALKAVGLDLHRTTIYKWMMDPEKGGAGGLIPSKNWPHIFAAARLDGVMLTENELDFREEERVKSIREAVISKGIVVPVLGHKHRRNIKNAAAVAELQRRRAKKFARREFKKAYKKEKERIRALAKKSKEAAFHYASSEEEPESKAEILKELLK
jgi:hypothetical protein